MGSTERTGANLALVDSILEEVVQEKDLQLGVLLKGSLDVAQEYTEGRRHDAQVEHNMSTNSIQHEHRSAAAMRKIHGLSRFEGLVKQLTQVTINLVCDQHVHVHNTTSFFFFEVLTPNTSF